MTKVKSLLLLILMQMSFSSFAQRTVTLGTLLEEMTDRDRVTQWPAPFFQAYQASSYDRHSVSPEQPGWFANADASQFIRKETVDGHTEYVMLDEDGPGAIVRFWLTTFKRDGVLRIYFDNQAEAEISIPGYDLLKIGLPLGKALLIPHSSYEPKEKGGSNLYLPMPFSRHCKITWEEAAPEVKEPRYYQINFRKYPAGTAVKTFTLEQIRQLQPLVDQVNHKLLNPTVSKKGTRNEVKGSIDPGKQISLTMPRGNRAIRSLDISVRANSAQDYSQALRSTILQIRFDGQQTVWCPIGDFSGSGVGGKLLQSWYRTVNNEGKITSRWIMPYRYSARINVINLGTKPVSVTVNALTDVFKVNSNTMYFHADWKAEREIPVRKSEEDHPIDWNLNTIHGKGIFVGESLAVYNHMHAWYGEGDQKLWVDQAKFPVEFGTGTEDYYNTSWAPVVLYQTPFANAPRADNADSFGYNTFTRTRILDAVPFKHNFRFDLEMLGWQNGTIDAATVTYWYGFKKATSILKENKKEAKSLLL